MIRTLLVTAILFTSACRTNHLGSDTGVAYRAALTAQRESDPDATPTFGAEDAKATNAARRTDRGKAGGSTMPAPGSILLPTPSAAGGGAWPGAQGNMSLEAK